ncbi:PucR family transcriptional regulator [Streptomyces sp. NRRL S-1521]|uniref:PucR family transcriptional regulator n=1 Tax=Streptomyces sp. NRRL S-1521 TaxID=1609100 RepID=UPI000747519D|nr:helix-turn-helix domain-containing protein [Streptomyces sp. NRRL S-1521]KUL63877.1 PucR family transcriptional regulator [Streptomyces sp. NRRL S-1521]
MISDQPTNRRTSLARVLADFSPALLDLVAGEPEPADEVGGVVIHDPGDEVAYPRRAIVLGVGVYGTEGIARLMRQAGEHGAAALVVRGPVERDQELATASAASGVALISLTQGASWSQLTQLLRTLLTEGDVGDAGVESLGGVPSGDLFALANAVATLLDAPITIEDRRQRILAFSGRQDEADQARVATILARRVPDAYLRILDDRGVFSELYRSDRPVHIAPAAIEEGESAIPRIAVAVRAGDEFLGSVWAAVEEPLTPERERAFQDAAKLVALHLLRHRAGADARNRLRADLVGTVLGGGAGAVDALHRLGLVKESMVVMAMGLTGEEGDHARLAAERQRLTSALGIHLNAVQPRSALALLGDVAYAIVPVPADPAAARERAVRIAADFVERAGKRSPVVIGIGSVAADPSELGPSRTRADRALRVLMSDRSGRRVASIADVSVDALLLEMRDLATARGDELLGPVARLVEYDARHRSHLVETLSAWLEAFGDTVAASASTFVHPNTFRYRVRRAAEVARVDLRDPSVRFALMLQLRLMRPPPGSAGA